VSQRPKENYHLFLPLLYQVAIAGLSPGNIPVPSAQQRLRGARPAVAEQGGWSKAAARGGKWAVELLSAKRCLVSSYGRVMPARLAWLSLPAHL
jgi:hypothetical protein